MEQKNKSDKKQIRQEEQQNKIKWNRKIRVIRNRLGKKQQNKIKWNRKIRVIRNRLGRKNNKIR